MVAACPKHGTRWACGGPLWMEQRFHACKTSQNNRTTKADATVGDFARGYYYKQNLPARDKGYVHLALSHVANGRYARQVYRIGYEINDAYSDYLAMGAPSQLTPQQVRYLKEKNSGAATAVDTVTVTEGIIRYDLPLRTNDVYLVLLTKIAD